MVTATSDELRNDVVNIFSWLTTYALYNIQIRQKSKEEEERKKIEKENASDDMPRRRELVFFFFQTSGKKSFFFFFFYIFSQFWHIVVSTTICLWSVFSRMGDDITRLAYECDSKFPPVYYYYKVTTNIWIPPIIIDFYSNLFNGPSPRSWLNEKKTPSRRR